jgi:nucleotide-binding universal stress UspA family protein
MLRHVLVPLDGSALSEQALYHAMDILGPNGRITLLTVMEAPFTYEYAMLEVPLTMMTSRAYTDEEFKSAQHRVTEYLNSNAKKLHERGYEVEILVETGDPATVIHDVAAKQKANAIVLTTHGRTGLSRWLFGSVSQKVISQMPCPVYLVPGIQPEEAAETAEATAEQVQTVAATA